MKGGSKSSSAEVAHSVSGGTRLEPHPTNRCFEVLRDEVFDHAEELLKLRRVLQSSQRSSPAYYKAMARLGALLSVLHVETESLREEMDRLDEQLTEP